MGTKPGHTNNDKLEDEEAKKDPVINANNARGLSIDTLELFDAILMQQSLVDREFKSPEPGESTCDLGGGRSTTGSNPAAIRYQTCKLETEQGDITLAGTATFTMDSGDLGTDQNSYTLEFDGFSVTTHSPSDRTVTYSGAFQTENTPLQSQMSAGQDMTINDGQSDFLIKPFTIVQTRNNVETSTTELAFNSGRYDIDVKAVTMENLTGSPVSCPESGELEITATDGSKISITGTAGGTTLGVDVNEEAISIDCSSIGQAADLTKKKDTSGTGTGGGGLPTPPPPPGS